MGRILRNFIGISMSYFFAVAILLLLGIVLTRDIPTSLGFSISVVGWWGWFLWALNIVTYIDQTSALFLSIIAPLSLSLAISSILSLYTKLKSKSLMYTSITMYYVIGTLYFTLSKKTPDIGLEVILPFWLILLLIGVVISNKILDKYSEIKSSKSSNH